MEKTNTSAQKTERPFFDRPNTRRAAIVLSGITSGVLSYYYNLRIPLLGSRSSQITALAVTSLPCLWQFLPESTQTAWAAPFWNRIGVGEVNDQMGAESERKKEETEKLAREDAEFFQIVENTCHEQIKTQEDCNKLIDEVLDSLMKHVKIFSHSDVKFDNKDATEFAKDYNAYVTPLIRTIEKYQDQTASLEDVSKSIARCIQKVYKAHLETLKKFINYKAKLKSQIPPLNDQVTQLNNRAVEAQGHLAQNLQLSLHEGNTFADSIILTAGKLNTILQYIKE